MSDPGNQHTNRPMEGAVIKPLGYFLGLHFHPGINLGRKVGYEFASTLADYIDPERADLEGGWTFSSATSGLRVNVSQTKLEFHGTGQLRPQEWYEEQYGIVLRRFEETFQPQVILSSSAMIRGLAQIDGDARQFLASHVMNLHPSRLDPLGRPIHLLGIRLFFPPFEIEPPQNESLAEQSQSLGEWGVDVKIESWMPDPKQIFIEADASWDSPVAWEDRTFDDVIGRLRTVSEYLEKIRTFLQHDPSEGE